jgi:prepilin-type N-terminal cleavage/methylation domain-containing protein
MQNLSEPNEQQTRPSRRRSFGCSGFTLVELAIVLVIVALLTGGLLLGISAQRNVAENAEAQRQLENVREALLGFAMTNGRLPCPARPDLAAGTEDCALEHGVLPWATLALPETDPWGRRFTYYAGSAFTGALPAGSLASFSLSTNGKANVREPVPPPLCPPTVGKTIASDLSAVIVSHGSRGAGGRLPDGTRIAGDVCDEAENADAASTNPMFVAGASNAAFDDLVVWIAPSILKSKMVAAGRLP